VAPPPRRAMIFCLFQHEFETGQCSRYWFDVDSLERSFSVDREQKHGIKKIHILIVNLTVVQVFGSI
jgi:hypothetical protein